MRCSAGFVLPVLLVIGGCAMDQSGEIADESTVIGGGKADSALRPIQIHGVWDEPARIDPFQIDGLDAGDGVLSIDVAYRGCQQHDLSLHTTGLPFTAETPVMVFTLVNDGHGDACAEMRRETVRFDLTALPDAPESYEALVLGNGWWVSVMVDAESETARAAEPLQRVDSLPGDGDAFVLSAARLSGDVLEVEVGYSGGCAAHAFSLYWDGRVRESWPLQASLRLVHDANGDACEGFSTETLRFDLSSLDTSTPMRLSIEGAGNRAAVDAP